MARADWADRAKSRPQDNHRKLGGTGSLAEPFPDKPKGTHWKADERLVERANVAEEHYDVAVYALLARDVPRMERRWNRRRGAP